MPSIRAESLTKTFGIVRALDGINLEVRDGELFFLLGASGCGKTTLLRCIAGLETPSSGLIRFGERDVTQMPPHKREAAMVFQSYALWPHLTVGQNIAFGLEERKVPKAEVRQRVAEALERVELAGFGERSIDQMSGGQQQRVSLARALVVKPECLLLDEPLSNLDARLRVGMRREIRSIVKDHGLTAIYVTHDQEEALTMADRIAVLTEGRIAQVATPEEIYRKPASAMVASFIGDTNLIEGEIAGQQNGSIFVKTAAGMLDGVGHPLPTGESVRLSIRPEAWTICDQSTANAIAGRIRDRSYLGQRILYGVETAVGYQQVMEMNPHHLRESGEQVVFLQVRPDDVVVLKS
ncbi:MAG: ABC transporter ATP-binding protein [Verrucomicrobiota bacterium]